MHAPAVAWRELFRGGGMRLVRADYPPALWQHRHWHARADSLRYDDMVFRRR